MGTLLRTNHLRTAVRRALLTLCARVSAEEEFETEPQRYGGSGGGRAVVRGTQEQLKRTLVSLDGRGYAAYKDIIGLYAFCVAHTHTSSPHTHTHTHTNAIEIDCGGQAAMIVASSRFWWTTFSRTRSLRRPTSARRSRTRWPSSRRRPTRPPPGKQQQQHHHSPCAHRNNHTHTHTGP
jgi:hypothetical protein